MGVRAECARAAKDVLAQRALCVAGLPGPKMCTCRRLPGHHMHPAPRPSHAAGSRDLTCRRPCARASSTRRASQSARARHSSVPPPLHASQDPRHAPPNHLAPCTGALRLATGRQWMQGRRQMSWVAVGRRAG
eukprot:366569-Chlamydomonas_euryale.AAC.1